MESHLLNYSGVTKYDWAAKLIDPKAHEKYEKGDGFERLNSVRRLLESRHVAYLIISQAQEQHRKAKEK